MTNTSVRPDIWTRKLSFENGAVLETTDEHPLYVEGSGFAKAKEVGIGSSIVTRAGPSAKVVAVQGDVRQTTVYNFTVDEFHTYFVGQSALWVHNVDCDWLDAQNLHPAQQDDLFDVLQRIEHNGETPTWLRKDGHWGDDWNATTQGTQLPDPGINPKIYDLNPAAFPAANPAQFPGGAGRLIVTTKQDGTKLHYFTDDHYTSFKLINPLDFKLF